MGTESISASRKPTAAADAVARFCIFLSRVNSEFENAASSVASDLRARGLEVKIQEDFRQESGTETTLDKLHHYIRHSDAVVAIVGNRTGSFPPDSAALKYVQILPDGVTHASYTQWEVLFAQHYQKRLSFYDGRAFSDHPRVAGVEDDPAQQANFIRWLFEHLGLDRVAFSTIDQLGRSVLREDWPLLRPYQPRNLPYTSLGQLFKGREEFLERVRQAFRSGARAAGISATPAVAATHGLGGIGKTRLAVEYALRHAGEYDALIFLPADTPEKLDASLAGLTGPLVLNLPEKNVPDPTAQKAAVFRWLQAHPRFFLIIDNVDDAKAAAAAQDLIRQLPGGDIVLTGRISRWPLGVQSLELNVLSTDDASNFLLTATDHRRPASDDEAQARVVAVYLGGLAVALSQAAAYINEQRITFAGYLGDWDRQHDAVLQWFDESVSQYPKSVAITWRTSWEKLPPGAARLLELLAWFAPDPVPEQLLENPATATMNAEHPPATDRQALADLARYSLATRAAERPLFSLHRLVQDVTRRRIEKEGRAAELRQQAIAWMAEVFTGSLDQFSDWPRFDALAPHAVALAETARTCNLPKLAGRLYWALGLWMHSHGRYTEAIAQGRRIIPYLQTSLGCDHPDTLKNRNTLGNSLKAQGNYADAEAEHRAVLAIRQRVLGSEHPDTLKSRNNLAYALSAQGKYAEAEVELCAVLPIKKRVLGPEHLSILISRDNLALTLAGQGRHVEAAAEHGAVLDIRQRIQGPEHPDTLVSRYGVAVALHGQQRYTEAEFEHRAVLTVRERVLGAEHPKFCRSCYGLSLCLEAQGKKAEALRFARQALAGWQKMLGETHPDTKDAMTLVERLEQVV